MSFRDNAVNFFARMIGAGDYNKAKAAPPPAQSTQSANDLPAAWLTSTYAPGWPIQPITSGGTDASRPEDMIPREIDYPISVNATLLPRTAYGLMPFAALKEAYETVAEIRLPVSTLLREMSVFRPHLVDKDGGEVKNHPYEWLVSSPDRITGWDVWLTRFLKSSLIFDAGAFFYEYDGVNLNGIRYIDGSTLFIMVDEHGQVPKPNDVSKDIKVQERFRKKADEWMRKGKSVPRTTPAYAQVIKGTPFAWYDASQIWYKPRSRRYDAPYGETAIEQSWAWILICANVTGFELSHYREGNMPEGWVNAPTDWTLERISAFETAFNQRMSSGASERMRARFLPAGMTWNQTKKADFPRDLYDQAMNMISLFFGVPPSEYGKVPGSGLGGGGFENAMQSTLFRMGLFPLKNFIEGAMNEVLERSGVKDVKFDLTFPSDETDPAKHKENVIELLSNGLITFNNALAELGQDRIEGGDVHVMVEYGSVTILEDVLGGITPPPGTRGKEPVDPDAPQFDETNGFDDSDDDSENNFDDDSPKSGKPRRGKGSGKPRGKYDTDKGFGVDRKEKMTDKDKQIAEKMIAQRSLSPDNKFFLFPQTVKVHGNDLRKGGPGSGNFGHSGRAGLRGGSGGGGMLGGGSASTPMQAAVNVQNILQRAGGEGISNLRMLERDEDLDLYVERGEVIDGAEAIQIYETNNRMRPGNCHSNSALLLRRGDAVAIGTGYAISEGDTYWTQHSWAYDADGNILETTFPRESYFGVVLTSAEAAAFAKGNH